LLLIKIIIIIIIIIQYPVVAVTIMTEAISHRFRLIEVDFGLSAVPWQLEYRYIRTNHIDAKDNSTLEVCISPIHEHCRTTNNNEKNSDRRNTIDQIY
jgi:5-bromo-4-chloroindolyl phosphate hydrolysis protein